MSEKHGSKRGLWVCAAGAAVLAAAGIGAAAVCSSGPMRRRRALRRVCGLMDRVGCVLTETAGMILSR